MKPWKCTAPYFLLSLFLLLAACKKESDALLDASSWSPNAITSFESDIYPTLTGWEKDFFTEDHVSSHHPIMLEIAQGRALHPIIDAARANIYLQHEQSNFELLPLLISKAGLPMWDQSIVYSETDNTLSIPFTTFQDSTITGFLVGRGFQDNQVFHFELITKAEVDDWILQYSYDERFLNQAFFVLTIFDYTYELFDVRLDAYTAWFDLDGSSADQSGPRFTHIEHCKHIDMVYVKYDDGAYEPAPLTAERGAPVICVEYTLPCPEDPQGPSSCLGCSNGPPSNNSGGGSSGSSGNGSTNGDEPTPNPLEDGGHQDTGDNNSQEHMECLADIDNYIINNGFTLAGLKMHGVDLDPCCVAENFKECAWEDEIAMKYGFDFDWSDYQDYILPVLNGIDWSLDDFISHVDLNACMLTEDVEACIAVEFLTSVNAFDIDQINEQVNPCEAALILAFPTCAYSFWQNSFVAIEQTDQIFGFNGENDCSDAFRHAFYNALNAYTCGGGVAKLFGDAHECNPDPEDVSSTAMDLHNNQIGVTIANENPNATTEVVATLICEQLALGNLIVLEDINDNSSPLLISDNCECM